MRFMKPIAATLVLALGAASLPSCTAGAIDPVKVAELAKTTCGILIAASSVLELINAGAGLTAQALVDMVCSSFKAQQAAGLKALPPGAQVHVPVVVNGKTVDVLVTVQ
jgi:hypothetical protein